jgi:hypothetical protein
MSQRGSYVTEFIYCYGCYAAMLSAVKADRTVINSVIYDGRIICGQTRAGALNNEIGEMEYMLESMRHTLCAGHTVRVCIMAEGSEYALFVVSRGGVLCRMDKEANG